MSELLPIGTLVRHGFGVSGHGPGMIVAYNQVQPNHYVKENLNESVNMVGDSPVMLEAIVSGFYDKETFPYVLSFSNGYKDVYSRDNFEVIHHDGLEFVLSRQTHLQNQEGITEVDSKWSVSKTLQRHGRNAPGRCVWFISGGFTLRYRIYDAEKDVGIEVPWTYVRLLPSSGMVIEQRLAASYAPRTMFAPTWEMEEITRQATSRARQVMGEYTGRDRKIDFDVYFTYESMSEKEYLNRTCLQQVDLRTTFPDPEKIRRFLERSGKLENLKKWVCKDCGTSHFEQESSCQTASPLK